MKLSWLPLSACLLQHISALPTLSKREADFKSANLLSRLDRPLLQTQPQPQDYQTPQTYFQQSLSNPYHDARFASQPLSPQIHHSNLRALAQSYLLSMNDLGVPTWLTHETLRTWYRIRRLYPEQKRIDVMVSGKSMRFLADFCNMTVYSHKLEGMGRKRREYLLEVSPFLNGSRGGEVNARWIDTYSGLFIDVLMDREDGSVESGMASYPLLETTFEGVKARVPAGYAALLEKEYGREVLSPLESD